MSGEGGGKGREEPLRSRSVGREKKNDTVITALFFPSLACTITKLEPITPGGQRCRRRSGEKSGEFCGRFKFVSVIVSNANPQPPKKLQQQTSVQITPFSLVFIASCKSRTTETLELSAAVGPFT